MSRSPILSRRLAALCLLFLFGLGYFLPAVGQSIPNIRQGLRMIQLGIPAAPTGITHGGTAGSTSYTYAIAAVGLDGVTTTGIGPTTSTSTGATTLTGTNTNIVAFATPVYGASTYALYRTASSGTGNSATLGLVTTGKTSPLTDTGTAATQFTPTLISPTGNNTGNIQFSPSASPADTSLTRYAAGQVGIDSSINGNLGNLYAGSLTTTALSNVSAPTGITHGGTAGSTNYTYGVTAVQADGSETACLNTLQTTTGNATLTSTNTNIIAWTGIAGAQTYNIYRTASSGTPSTTGKIGNTTGASAFTDTGIAVISANIPAQNITGCQFGPANCENSLRCYTVSNSPRADGSSSGNSTVYVGPDITGNIQTYQLPSGLYVTGPVTQAAYTVTGLTGSTQYDLYENIYLGTFATSAWSTNTPPTRGTDAFGRSTETGNTAFLLVGEFRAGSATTTYDYTGRRWLISRFNRQPCVLFAAGGSATLSTTTGPTWGTTDGTGQVSIVIASDGPVPTITFSGTASASAAGQATASMGYGINVTTAFSNDVALFIGTNAGSLLVGPWSTTAAGGVSNGYNAYTGLGNCTSASYGTTTLTIEGLYVH